MAVQQIRQTPLLGGRYGEAVGQGIGQGIESLLNTKIKGLQSQQKQKEYRQAGLTPEESYFLAQFEGNPTAQEKLLTGFLQGGSGRYSEQPQKNPFAAFEQPEMEQSSPFSALNQLQSNQPQIGAMDALSLLQGKTPQGVMEQLQGGQPQPQMPQAQPQPKQQKIPSSQQVQSAQPQRPTIGGGQRTSQIEKVNQPYNTALDKRLSAAEEVLDKGQQMLSLLQNGDVASGWLGAYLPYRTLGEDSEEFNGLGDDAATALTGLQTGVQTQSKIKFNKERKANLGQNRETQFRRVKDMNKTAEKILVEGDIRSNLIQNGQPENLSSQVGKVYARIKNDIPEIPENAEIGQSFVDDKTGAIWTVGGNRMIFSGIQGRK